MISIALIEDNRLVRDGMAALLSQQPDIEVVAAATSEDTVGMFRANPQVILLDLGLRNASGLRMAEQIRKDLPVAKVIAMDLLPVHEDIVELVNAGISGFIMKDATLEDLVETIRAVAKGTPVLPPQVTATLFSQIAREAVARGRPDALDSVRMTPREREVVNLISEGLSNKEIAARLQIAIHTVKSHVRNVLVKLTLHTRLEIAAYARREGVS